MTMDLKDIELANQKVKPCHVQSSNIRTIIGTGGGTTDIIDRRNVKR